MPRQKPPRSHGAPVDIDHELFDADDIHSILSHVGLPLVERFDQEGLRTNLCQIARWHRWLIKKELAPSVTSELAYLRQLGNVAQTLCSLLPLNELPDGGSPDEYEAEPAFGVWRLLNIPLHEEMQHKLAKAQVASLRASEARANSAKAADDTVRPSMPQVDSSITLEDLFGSAYGKDVLILATRINGVIAAAAERAHCGIDPTKKPAPATNEQVAVKLMKLYGKAFGREPGFSRPSFGEDKTVGGPMIRFVQEYFQKMDIQLKPGTIAKYMQENFPSRFD